MLDYYFYTMYIEHSSLNLSTKGTRRARPRYCSKCAHVISCHMGEDTPGGQVCIIVAMILWQQSEIPDFSLRRPHELCVVYGYLLLE